MIGSIGCWAKRATANWAKLLTLVFSAWTTPRTWATGELVTADLLNTHIRDNLNALKTPPSSEYHTDSDYTTDSTSYVPVDVTSLTMTVTTYGGDVFVLANMTLNVDGDDNTAKAAFDVYFDGELVGMERLFSKKGGATNDRTIVTLLWVLTDVEAGEHVYRLGWCVSGNNPDATIRDIQMVVQEIS